MAGKLIRALYYRDEMYVRKAGMMLDIKILAGTVVYSISLLTHSILSILPIRKRKNNSKGGCFKPFHSIFYFRERFRKFVQDALKFALAL